MAFDGAPSVGDGLIVVGFAGGGGSSLAVRLALGRDPDLAMNHKKVCVLTHAANFPNTDHIQTDIFEMDPRDWRPGAPIALAWFSPDCTDFSKAKGKAPRSPRIRGLAWAVIPWAVWRRPAVIMVENVEEFEQWGPVYRSGPREGEPIPERRGETFQRWVSRLRHLGYKVEWRKSRAARYGDPTIRQRLLIVATLLGDVIWPAATHAPRDEAEALGLSAYRGACECVDFSRRCPSIFMTQDEAKAEGLNIKRPLVKATHGRVARGVDRYVVGRRPFLVELEPAGLTAHLVAGVAHGDGWRRGGDRIYQVADPLRTLTGQNDKALVSAYLVPRYGERAGQEPRVRDVRDPYPTAVPDGNGGGLAAVHLHQANTRDTGAPADAPLRTAPGKAHQGVVAAYLGRQFGSTVSGRDLTEPHPTVMSDGGGGKSQLIAAHLSTYYGGDAEVGSDLADPARTATGKDRHALTAAWLEQANTGMVGHSAADPVSTIVGMGSTQRLVQARLELEGGPVGRREQVLEFLWEHFGEPTAEEWADPMATHEGRLKFGLVELDGLVWIIVDIGLRMLFPDELAAAMGFPAAPEYDLSRDVNGAPVSKVQQTEMIGNAVPRRWAAAHIAANCPHLVRGVAA